MAFAKYPILGSGLGDVAGPASSVANGVVLFNGTTGKLIKDLGVGTANQVLVTNGTTPAFALLVDANISASAAIAYSKLAALTINRALVSDGSGFVSASAVTSTELGYLSGVTSAIQTQFSGKVGTTGNETIAGSKTFSSAVAITSTTNQLILGTTNTVTISASAPAASRVYTIADPGQSAAFVMDRGSQTLQGTYTFTQQTMTQNVGSGTSALYSIVSTATNPQLYNEYQSTVQTWRVGLNVDGSNVGSYVIYDFTGTSTRAALTTAGQFQLPATTNQIRLGTTNTTTISATAPAASRVYTLPDAGAAAEFVLSAGASTISALKTFSAGLAVTGGTAAASVLSRSGTTWTIGNGPTITEAGAAVFATSVTSPSFLSTGAQVVQSVTTQTLNAGTSFALNVANATTPVSAITATAAGALTFPVATTHQFGASAGAAATALLVDAAAGQQRDIFIRQAGVSALGLRVDSSNVCSLITNNTTLFFSTGVAAGNVTNAGAWTLGPAAGGVTHRINTNTATTATTGTVVALPALARGFWTVNINGTDRKVPYFDV